MDNKSIVPFIKNQFPQHIAETDSLLIPFMEAYYEWLHNENNVYDIVNKVSELHNIDKSLNAFSAEFTSEYLSHFPSDIVTDKATTIKHINDLYKAKGTPAATKLLIKMLYGKESEIFYPSSQILRASDGEWIQENSIYVTISSGDIFTIVGESVKISTANLSFNSVVERVKLSPYDGIYEVYLERKLIYDITEGSILSYNNVIAVAQSTITDYEIVQNGSGFTVGQIFEAVSAEGSGTIVKVKSITATGGIKSVQIIKFGYGYESKFIIQLNTSVRDTSIATQFPTLSDEVSSVTDEGIINLADYFQSDYIDGTFSGKILTSFKDNPLIISDSSSARIKFTLGSKLKYPGYYNSVKGFLSNSIYLQDNLYYQVYSYVIRVDELLEKYKEKVVGVVHPAGLKLFGEYAVNNDFKLKTKLTFVLNFFRVLLDDTISLQEAYTIATSKTLTELASAADNNVLNLNKPLTELQPISDNKAISFSTLFAEFQSLSDLITITLLSTRTLTDTISEDDIAVLSSIKVLQDSISQLDATALNFSTSYADSYSITDLMGVSVNIMKTFSENIANADTSIISTTKSLDESITTPDIQSINSSKVLSDSITQPDLTGFNFTTSYADIATIIDLINVSLVISQALSDSFSNTDSSIISFIKSLDDITTQDDTNLALLTTKYIDDTVIPNTSGYLFYNYYTDIDYWNPDYSEGSSTFT